MTDKSDRKRLEAEVHTTDLKESQLNEDFIDNLKQYGPWILVAVLSVIAVRLWMSRTAQDAIIKRDTAWYELLTTTEPASLEDVALTWSDVDSVSSIARLQAGSTLLRSIAAEPDMAEADRTEALNAATAAFSQVLTADDGARATTVIAVTAMNGLAAVAESKGDAETARSWYAKSESRAAGWLEPLAEQARRRAESADAASQATSRPKRGSPPSAAGGLVTPFLGPPTLQTRDDVDPKRPPVIPVETAAETVAETTAEDTPAPDTP